MKLYVGNLDYSVTGDQLAQLFGQVGQVVEAVVISDRNTGRSKGFGFVEMADEEAKKAMEKFNEFDFNGRKLRVNEARPLQPRQDFRPRNQ
jgi:cold-inducible RNA-binding protein